MDADPFETLGLPATYRLTRSEVQRAALSKLTELHPDRNPISGSDSEADGAARVNAARATLADPFRRGEALLHRLGGPSAGEDKSLPPAFLVEILTLREELDAALAAGDQGELARIRALAEERRQRHEQTIAGLFDQVQALEGDRLKDTLSRVRLELNTWRYTDRVLERVDTPDTADGVRGGAAIE